jgi:oligopeptide/dipeptide ABC transporter ATP-binding protein
MSATENVTVGESVSAGETILEVEDLEKRFTGRRRSRLLRGGERAPDVIALDGVSFTVKRGETFGIVGESGCGKSTLCRAVLRLTEPSSGSVRFAGTDVLELDAEQMRRLRRRMQIVLQDPFGSLDPRMTVLQIVREPLDVHAAGDPLAERNARAARMLELVGIAPAQHNRRPFAFSGGQRQRVGIARALVLEPELVFLDEPVSALDVSIQAQVLNLLRSLREELGLTYVFIVHDLAVAEYFCDRVAVLYRGAVMELADRRTLFKAPLHPYTASLLSAVPVPDPELARARAKVLVSGQVTPNVPGVSGCRFRERCPVGREREQCAAEDPALRVVADGHQVACHYPGELLAGHAELVGKE